MAELPKVNNITPEQLQAVWSRVQGPVVFNVVCVAYDQKSNTEGRDGRTRVAWLCDGKQNTGEFAAPCQIPIRDGDYTFTLSIFRCGTMVVTGAAHENIARAGLWNALLHIYWTTGHRYSFRDFQVVNVHSTVYMNCALDTKAIQSYFPEANSIEEFIKMVKITLKEPSVTCLVYKTGSLVLTGASNRQQLVEAMHQLIPFLANFVVNFDNSEEERLRVEGEIARIKAKLMQPTSDL